MRYDNIYLHIVINHIKFRVDLKKKLDFDLSTVSFIGFKI